MRNTLLAAWLVLGAALAIPPPAAACQPNPTVQIVTGVAPKAAAVALNAPLIVQFKEVDDTGLFDPVPFDAELTLRVAGSVTLIPTTRSDAAFEADSFVPAEPLLPNTTYEATYSTPEALAKPNAHEQPPFSWSFTTGEHLLPTLKLVGKLSAAIERGTRPTFVCDDEFGSCGGACPEGPPEQVLKARVTLPAIAGGAEEYGYRARLLMTDETAHDFEDPNPLAVYAVSLYALEDLAGGGATDVELTLPAAFEPFLPCFALEVWDARHDRVIAETLCLEAPVEPLPAAPNSVDPPRGIDDRPPAKGAPPVPPTTRPDAEGDPQAADGSSAEESNTSTSCSFGAAGKTSPSAWLAAIGLCALAALKRRRAGAQS